MPIKYNLSSKVIKELSNDDKYIIPCYVPFKSRINRKCQRSNYIPHNPHINISICEWCDAYSHQLMNIYDIMNVIMEDEYPQITFNWDNKNIFINLSKVLYHCSSKYIHPSNEKPHSDSGSKKLTNYDKDG